MKPNRKAKPPIQHPEFRRIREQTRRDFYSLWSGWHTREKRKPSAWAAQERRIAAGQSPLTHGEDIPYDHAVMPHCVEPMDEADNPEVNVIVLWMARRMGKTEGICGNIIGRTVTDDPANIYSMWPVEDSSERFSRDVIEPMIAATPSLNRVFVERKSRDSGRTIDYKRFHGGSLYIVNAGSRSKSRGMAAKVVLLHEVDAYPVSSQGEGDPIAKAFGRADGFEAIKIIESTGTFTASKGQEGQKVYRSNIELWYERGDQRKWFCCCRKCGREQVIKWEHIRPDGTDYAVWCEFCDTPHNEKQWRRMVTHGKWKPTAPFTNGIRSYWINQFCSLFPKAKGFKSKLHQFAVEGERALAGKPEEKQVWINEVKAELWDPEGEIEAAPDYREMMKRREPFGKPVTVPANALVLTAAVDVHKNRLEILWQGWGEREESWALEHVVLPGECQDDAVWKELEKELARKWRHELGGTAELSLALIDAGKWPDWVYRFLQRRPLAGRIRACRGASVYPHPIIDQRYKSIARNLHGHWVGGDAAKDLLYSRFRLERADPLPDGWIHFSDSLDEVWFQQATSEKVSIVYRAGEEFRRYLNEDHARNEALDVLVYNLAAFRLRRWNFEAQRAALSKPQDEQPDEQPKPSQRPAVMPQMPGLGRGWSL